MIRELTNAELDFVAGGLRGVGGGCNTGTASFATMRRPTQGCGGGIEELIADILRILESNSCCCNSNQRKALAA